MSNTCTTPHHQSLDIRVEPSQSPSAQPPPPGPESDSCVPAPRRVADAILETVVEERRAAARRLMLIASLVEEYQVPQDPGIPGATRGTPVADGVPAVDEFLVPELAALLGTGIASAWTLVRDVVCLVHRHPHAWAALADDRAEAWQARQVAAACRDAGLDEPAALWVDHRLAPCWGAMPWARVRRRLTGLIAAADPQRAAARRHEARRRRFLVMRHDETGMTTLRGRLPTPDALALTHRLDQISSALLDDDLTRDGDSAALAADALGILARSGAAPAKAPTGRATMVVHISRTELTSAATGAIGVAHVEGPGTDLGAVLTDDLAAILGGNTVRVLPVVDLADDPVIDGYLPTRPIHRHVALREPVSVFPFSAHRARRCDLDHTDPWRASGRPGQTRPSNLGPLARLEHRVKTFGGWRLTQPRPGRYEWTSPLGFRYVVEGGRTTRCTHPDGRSVDPGRDWFAREAA